MKKIAIILAILFSAGSISAQDNAIDMEKGMLQFEKELIDYGTIEQSTNGIREFKFTNTGSEPVIISNIESSCGCTVPSYSKEPILPGKKGSIQVKYDTKRLGAINKSITVVSNAKRSRIVLRIKGKIIQPENMPTKKNTIPAAN